MMMGEAKRKFGIFAKTTITAFSSNCLNCGVEIDAATSIDHGHVPHEGAIAICIVCSHIMAYNKDVKLRELTDEEILFVAGNKEILFHIDCLGGAKAEWEKKHGKDSWGATARERLVVLKGAQAKKAEG
jgi:hypothetical protein